MTTKQKIVIGVVALSTAFAAGRWTGPEHIKTVEVDKKQTKTETDRDKHKETTTTETTNPDGTKTTVTKTTEDTKTDRKIDTVETDTKSKEITSSTAKVTVAAIAGIRLSDLTKPPVYGLMVQRPLLGPIGAVVWGLSDSTLGAGISLTF